MKIDGYASIGQASGAKKRAGTSSTGSFADILAAAEGEDTAAPSSLSDVSTSAALNNLLALQEISEEDVKRRKLTQQGKSLLDTLEKLRQQLLMGTLPPHLVQELSRQISMQKQFVADPGLNDLIADIELRAAVELAKLEVATGRFQQ